MTSVSTGFITGTHGFHFSNSEIRYSYGFHSGTALCGGMSFAALDFYCHRLPIPDLTTPPAEGTPLHTYILNRQHQAHLWAIPALMGRSDLGPHDVRGSYEASGAYGPLRSYLQTGRPCPLLLGARGMTLSASSHWVVATGCRDDDFGNCGGVILYDCNYPNIPSSVDPRVPAGHLFHNQEGGEQPYAFFLPYVGFQPRDPREVLGNVPLTDLATNPLGMRFPRDIM